MYKPNPFSPFSYSTVGTRLLEHELFGRKSTQFGRSGLSRLVLTRLFREGRDSLVVEVLQYNFFDVNPLAFFVLLGGILVDPVWYKDMSTFSRSY
jgi:hypothetical protein